MKVENFSFDSKSKWSRSDFPNLDSDNTLILVFASPEFKNQPEPILEVARHYPRAKMIGCSTAGGISDTKIMDESITFSVVQFEKTKIDITMTVLESNEDSYCAGENIVKKLFKKDLKGIFILSEGLDVNGSELANGLNVLGEHQIVMTGGLAGDGGQFQKTWSIYQGKTVENAIVAVGFYGDAIQLGFGNCGGWESFGPERQVTKAEKNVLFELDHKPALDLYKTYLGEKAAELPASGLLFPLGIKKNKEDSNQLVRTILGVDESNKSLIFAGDIPVGCWARLMRTNSDNLIQGAQTAAELAGNSINLVCKKQNTGLGIAVSCVGRRLILGERSEEEVESTFNCLPNGMRQIGFYSYGELSPRSDQACELHNQTMTMTVLCECDELV